MPSPRQARSSGTSQAAQAEAAQSSRRNDELLSEIFAKFDYVREAIAANEPPEHCCPLDSVKMKACPARFECWLSNKVVSE